MVKKDYLQAAQVYTGLRDYKDSMQKAEAAQAEHEALLAEAAKKETAIKLAAKTIWICPVCGKENVHFIYKCSCGAAR